jgi:hypothetical protein
MVALSDSSVISGSSTATVHRDDVDLDHRHVAEVADVRDRISTALMIAFYLASRAEATVVSRAGNTAAG